MAQQEYRPGPLHSTTQFDFSWSGWLEADKFEPKQVYFGYYDKYSSKRIDEPCIVLWSKEVSHNILIRGYEKIGKFFGQYFYGSDMSEEEVIGRMLEEEGLEWFIWSLKVITRGKLKHLDMAFRLMGGGSHPTTPSLWFNGYELEDCRQGWEAISDGKK